VFLFLFTKLISWTQAASGTAGRANVGFALHQIQLYLTNFTLTTTVTKLK